MPIQNIELSQRQGRLFYDKEQKSIGQAVAEEAKKIGKTGSPTHPRPRCW